MAWSLNPNFRYYKQSNTTCFASQITRYLRHENQYIDMNFKIIFPIPKLLCILRTNTFMFGMLHFSWPFPALGSCKLYFLGNYKLNKLFANLVLWHANMIHANEYSSMNLFIFYHIRLIPIAYEHIDDQQISYIFEKLKLIM